MSHEETVRRPIPGVGVSLQSNKPNLPTFFTVYLGCGAQPQQQNSDVDTGTGKRKVGDLRGLFCLSVLF